MKLFRCLVVLLLCSTCYATSVQLNWVQSTTTGVTGNNVYRSQVAGGPYVQVFSSPTKIVAWSDTTITAGELYCYVVTAVGPNGESPYSNEACGTAGTKAPTNLRIK